MIEQELRKLVKKHWPGWVDWLEPTGNAGVGRPDMDLLIAGNIAPVELKIGCLVGDVFKIERMRPDQISWQHRFYGAGGVSFFLIANSTKEIWLARKIIEAKEPYYTCDLKVQVELELFGAQISETIKHWRKQ